ncbi:ABC transporter permease [Streptomyces koyangensis]|uniref:ABC transporter permease n=1 Tax=Streptomyces koyangensis TaxID=188770 RepID=A0A385DFJ4_9ACTN|nr:ABC transporter permease [Streptomyces koyangensis]AXQ57185.1 ABC transporter permease [Streptomyces koyangensis]
MFVTRFVLLRLRAHRLLLTAALTAVLLTASVLATLTAFSGSVGEAALRHTLDHRAAADAALVVRGEPEPENREAADEAVAEGARRAFAGLPVTVRTLPRSATYALPGARGGEEPPLTHLAALDRSQLRLAAGTWPGDGGSGTRADPLRVALPESAAAALKLAPGGEPLTLTDRTTDRALTVEITGLYRPADTSAPYWLLDELGGRGQRTVDFTTYGPLLTGPKALAAPRVAPGPTGWLATADYATFDTSTTDALARSATASAAALAKDPALGTGASAETGLPQVLERSERALTVSRTTLLVVALQLVLLAGYALLLVARLLSTERAGETGLLLARGASRRRVAALAAVEALLLALPAVVLAPLLAGPLTRLLAGQGALERIGLRLDTSPTPTVWLVAVATALGCALAVVAPALSAASGEQRAGARTGALPGWVKAGADVALLVVAGAAYWQLNRQGTPDEGAFGVDPLLVAAPALALLAGTVLTLRLLPPVAKLAERRAAKGRGLAGALAGWQLSRRPLRGAGPVLLMVLAMAMGMLAVAQGATWERSQRDQADFAAGTEVRVAGGRVPEADRGRVYGGLDGVRDAAPVLRSTMDLAADRTAEVLAVDAGFAAEGLLLREDLGDRAELARQLRPATARQVGLPLPEKTGRAVLTTRLKAVGGDHGEPLAPRLTVVVEDRFGTRHLVHAGELPADGKARDIAVPLAAGKPGAGARDAAAPYTVAELRLQVEQPSRRGQRHELTVERIRAVPAGVDGAGAPVALPDGFAWEGHRDTGEEALEGGPPQLTPLEPATTAETPLRVSYRTGVAAATEDSLYRFEPGTSPGLSITVGVKRPEPPKLTAVATPRFLASSGAKTGSVIDVPVGAETLSAEITGTVEAVPTTGDRAPGATTGDGGALLLDLAAVNAALHDIGATAPVPGEWWLRTAPGDAAKTAAALAARPDTDPEQITDRQAIGERLRDDPLGAGPQAALLAVAVVAAALAAVGFAVSAAGSLRERGAELSVLRALGAPRRQLARLIAIEQAVLIGIALLVGPLLGALLARAVVPLVVLTGEATRPLPDVLVELPAGQVATLLAGVVAVPLLIVAALALRRGDPTVTLRHEGGR